MLHYFLGLGTWGFGGPIATVGYMQRDLVEHRRWLDRQDFLDGVALGQTMPGPLAAQVAMWVGFLARGALGALAGAAAVIIPSCAAVLGVAVVYVHYQGLVALGLFFSKAGAFVKGATAAAAGAIAGATVVLTRQAVTGWPTAAIALVALGVLWRFKVPEPLVVVGGALAGLLLHERQAHRADRLDRPLTSRTRGRRSTTSPAQATPGAMKEGGRGGRATSPPAVASTDRSQCRQSDDTAIKLGFCRW